ncbi:MAG: DUF421 domain-containing protein [Acidobacteriota bacterium]
MVTLDYLIGSDAQSITWWQMSIRATIIFFYILILLRSGSVRAFGKSTSFDIVVAILLGSTLSRTLTGNARFIPTITASAVIIILHRLLAVLAFHSEKVARLVKGRVVPLSKGDVLDPEAMRATSITSNDVEEALRSQKGHERIDRASKVYLERSGKISIIEKG